MLQLCFPSTQLPDGENVSLENWKESNFNPVGMYLLDNSWTLFKVNEFHEIFLAVY